MKMTVIVLVALVALSACGRASPQTAAPSPKTASPSPTAPSSSDSPSPVTSAKAAGCVTTSESGSCGPYTYPQNTGSNGYNTYVGNNIWNEIPGTEQTLAVTNPGDWNVVANLPAGNTAVVSYPSTSQEYPAPGGTSAMPLTDYASMYSRFTENMNANSKTSAEAAYDIWFDNSGKSDELMIQNDMSNRGSCADIGILATVDFGGSGGVPAQKWDFCKYGTELIWQLAPPNGDQNIAVWGSKSQTVNLLSMMKWVMNHGYLAAGSELDSIGYGWEICSTGGRNESFQISRFSTTYTLAAS